jgi:hypothetical protein
VYPKAPLLIYKKGGLGTLLREALGTSQFTGTQQ